jgi:hypothetical protein
MVTSPKSPLPNISKIDRTTAACSSLMTSAAGDVGVFLTYSYPKMRCAQLAHAQSVAASARRALNDLARSNSANASSMVSVSLFSGLWTYSLPPYVVPDVMGQLCPGAIFPHRSQLSFAVTPSRRVIPSTDAADALPQLRAFCCTAPNGAMGQKLSSVAVNAVPMQRGSR